MPRSGLEKLARSSVERYVLIYINQSLVADDTREVGGMIVLLESEARGPRSTRLLLRLCECTRRRSRLK